MREIKFRAWDKNNKTMKDWTEVCSDGFGSYAQNFFTRSDLELMQFIGLLDKNGKEIYEGDILSSIQREQNGLRPFKIRDVVSFSYGSFKVFSKNLGDCYTKEDCKTIKNFMWCQRGHLNIPDIYYEIFEMEVIGNIWENPELLKGAK